MKKLTEADIKALREAARVLEEEGISDFIYDIKELEGLGWDGPKVKAYGKACLTLERLARQEKI